MNIFQRLYTMRKPGRSYNWFKRKCEEYAHLQNIKTNARGGKLIFLGRRQREDRTEFACLQIRVILH